MHGGKTMQIRVVLHSLCLARVCAGYPRLQRTHSLGSTLLNPLKWLNLPRFRAASGARLGDLLPETSLTLM